MNRRFFITAGIASLFVPLFAKVASATNSSRVNDEAAVRRKLDFEMAETFRRIYAGARLKAA